MPNQTADQNRASVYRIDWTADRTPAEWNELADRLEAASHREDQEAAESFERCDTDGFLSQWAKGQTAQRQRLQASYARDLGVAEILCLFRDGVPVPSKQIDGRFGSSWAVLADWSDDARVVEWVGMSRAQNPAREAAFYAKKGFTLGTIRTRVDFWARTGETRFRTDLLREVVEIDSISR